MVARLAVDGGDVIDHIAAGGRRCTDSASVRSPTHTSMPSAARACAPLRHRAPARGPRGRAQRSARARCPPVKPVAPVTITRIAFSLYVGGNPVSRATRARSGARSAPSWPSSCGGGRGRPRAGRTPPHDACHKVRAASSSSARKAGGVRQRGRRSGQRHATSSSPGAGRPSFRALVRRRRWRSSILPRTPRKTRVDRRSP
jgi:hypothetical protein